MGIYIKGMEMPTNCWQCPVNIEICKRGYRYLVGHPELYDKRADDCPIIHVPPHGRLIDADKLMKLEVIPSDNWVFRAVEKAPTIIPAEESE